MATVNNTGQPAALSWEYLKDMVAWIKNPSIPMYGRWLPGGPARMEGGVDLTSPGGTPVYALASGQVVGAGNFWHGGGSCLYNGGPGCKPGYGVITTRVNVPGYGTQDLYYQHIKLAPGIQTCYANNCQGQYVQKGQLLGWIQPDVGELEMGFNANWGGVWGVQHPGAWATDPRPMLAALMGSTTDIPYAGTNPSGSMLGGIDLSGLSAFGEPIAVFIIALALIIVGLFLLAGKQIVEGGKLAGKVALA